MAGKGVPDSAEAGVEVTAPEVIEDVELKGGTPLEPDAAEADEVDGEVSAVGLGAGTVSLAPDDSELEALDTVDSRV